MRDIRYHGRASFPDFVQWVHLIVDYQRDMRSAWSILQDFHSKLMLDSVRFPRTYTSFLFSFSSPPPNVLHLNFPI